MSDPVFLLRATLLDTARAFVDDLLSRCESPIEELLLLALMRDLDWTISEVPGISIVGWPGVESHFIGQGAWLRHGIIMIAPQLEVTTSEGIYRIDLAAQYRHAPGAPPIYVAIECDGHEFHERTKEQAERDKRRDRSLQGAGWHVARFTGTEIWRDPHHVVAELLGLYRKLLALRGAAALSLHEGGA